MADREAVVYKKGIPAASLKSSGGRTTFAYLDGYLKSNFPAIATTLPKNNEPIELAGGATPAFFSGLLPEGQRLIAMRDRIKTSLSDEVGLLLDIGADLIGDVQVLNPGDDPEAERDVYKLSGNAEELLFSQVREQFFGSRASGLPGVQDKVSSKMLNAPIRYSDYEYILKLNPIDVPFAVENEHLFLSLAKKCGIEVPDAKLLADKKGEHALRLARFDRSYKVGRKVRLAQEDGAQISDVYPAAKYDLEFMDMVQGIISLCSASQVAALRLFRLLVFNWLIGNGDAHAKNFSILEGDSGEWRLAPGYDLMCTRFYDDRSMAMPLYGQSTNWDRGVMIKAARELGIPEKLAVREIERQLVVLATLPDQILSGSLPFQMHLRIEVSSFLKKRAKSLAE